jgi:hypothetical protein
MRLTWSPPDYPGPHDPFMLHLYQRIIVREMSSSVCFLGMFSYAKQHGTYPQTFTRTYARVLTLMNARTHLIPRTHQFTCFLMLSPDRHAPGY